MPAQRIKVLVVDDSAYARKVMRECLSAGGIDVVGVARDGLEALEKIAELSPDVITLDLVMPNLDGLGVLRALVGRARPRVVVVSMSDGDSLLGLAALNEGAFDVVHKPTALALEQLYELGPALVAVVKAAASAPARSPTEGGTEPRALSPLPTTRELLVIGASTGGPAALTRLISALPSNFPIAVALVLHIPPGYTAAFASRLADTCPLEVIEAEDGAVLAAGRVIVARAGRHLRLSRVAGKLRCELGLVPLETQHRPSIDVLFQSASEVTGARTLGVVLTGMGDDGLAGSRAICGAGGTVLTESEGSCVVYGMPRAVVEAGLSAAQVPIERMAEEILRFL